MGALFVPRSSSTAQIRQLQPRIAVPTIMASPPTVTSGAAATLPRRWLACTGSSAYRMASSPRGGFFTASRCVPETAGLALVPGYHVTPGTAGQTATGMLQVSFIHDGSDLELQLFNATTMLIRVDGEYVSFTSTAIAATVTYMKLAFGSRKPRRIDVIGAGISFMGVMTGWTDMLYPAPMRGPRVICLGDSFTQVDVNGWHNWFADCMGWDDIWASGIGGTGYVATNGGISKSFRDRTAADVIAYAPDIVLVMGSLNDSGAAAATLQSEAATMVGQIKDALPGCLVVGGYNATGGVEKMSASGLDAMDATRAGFVSGGGVWLNPIEMPLTFSGAVPATTVAGAVPAGRPGSGATPTTITPASHGLPVVMAVNPATNALPFAGAVVEVGSGATRERIHTTATAFAGNAYLAFDGSLQSAHAAGEPVVLRGPSYLTGRGKSGTPSGFGNADLYVSSDGVHPTPDGHRAIAQVQATLLRNYLGALD